MLGAVVGQAFGLVRERGEPVDHLDLLRLERRAAIELAPGTDEYVAIDAGLEPRGEPRPGRPPRRGLPVDDDGAAARLDGHQIVLGEQPMAPHRHGQRHLWIPHRRQVLRRLVKIVPPPRSQIAHGLDLNLSLDLSLRGQPLSGQPHLVLVNQPVERLAAADVRFMLVGRLGYGRGPGEFEQIPQLEPPPALDRVLEAGLVEDEVGGRGMGGSGQIADSRWQIANGK